MPEDNRQMKINGSLSRVECPYCGGQMFKSRKTMLQGIHIYWQKPWGSTLKMDEAVMPLACVECGGVILALRDASRVSREWKQLSEKEKKDVLEAE